MKKNNDIPMWQLCPKCSGSGDANIDTELLKSIPVKLLAQIYDRKLDKCPLCKGAMIISSINGKPPSQD